jgi:hypothetical protein
MMLSNLGKSCKRRLAYEGSGRRVFFTKKTRRPFLLILSRDYDFNFVPALGVSKRLSSCIGAILRLVLKG